MQIMNRDFQIVPFAFLLALLTVALAGPPQVLADTSAHEGIACDTCHGSSRLDSGIGTIATIDKCQQCHSFAEVTQGRFHKAARNRCLECHSFHNPSQVTAIVGNVEMALANDQSLGHCQACHDARGNLDSLSPGHETAADLYHRAAGEMQSISPSEACLRCHSEDSESPWRSAAGEGSLAINTHASHPFSIRVLPGKGTGTNWIAHQIDERLPLFDGVMECQTCHLLTVGTTDLMIPFDTKYDLCKGCHRHFGDKETGPVVADLSR
jgi:hypothetical protein